MVIISDKYNHTMAFVMQPPITMVINHGASETTGSSPEMARA